jgi:hypothetical protein
MSGSGRIVAVDNMDRLGRFRTDTYERLTQLRSPIGSEWASLLKQGRSHERREIGPNRRSNSARVSRAKDGQEQGHGVAGAAGGYRTYDLPLTKGVLYH